MDFQTLLTIFTFIFLAALPGRTTFVMLVLGSQSNPVGTFLGAAAAFAVQAGISVLLGELLHFAPQQAVELFAGLLFLFFAYRFWTMQPKPISERASGFKAAFFLVFMAEWGDISQIAIATEAARNSNHFAVLFCATLALWLIAFGAIFLGSKLKKAIPVHKIQQIAAVVFFGIGFYLIATNIHG